MKRNLSQRPYLVEVLTHIIGWGIVFGFPFLIMSRSGFNITWPEYLRHGCIVPLSFLIIFYLNYCLLIPCYLFKNHIKTYLTLNALCILLIATGSHFWQEFILVHPDSVRPMKRPDGPPKWIFFLRDIFSMVLTVGLSAAIRMSRRWAANEAARREAEQQRTEAELKNLRSQLNPHFLLNTLNNILCSHCLRCRQSTAGRTGTESPAPPCSLRQPAKRSAAQQRDGLYPQLHCPDAHPPGLQRYSGNPLRHQS